MIETALNGDVSRAIEFCEAVYPKWTWILRAKRAKLEHPTKRAKDTDWTVGLNTGDALVKAVLSAKSLEML